MASSRPFSTALGLLLVLGAAPARADYPNPAFYLGIFGGANLTLRDWNLGDAAHQLQNGAAANLPTHSPIVGGRIGWQMMEHAALEGEVAYLPVNSTAGKHNDFLSWDINLLVNILKSNWTPLVEVGAGSYHALGGDLGKEQSLRAHLGLGVRGLLTRWLALRIEVRDVVSTRGFDQHMANNLEVLAGLDVFVCGGKGHGDRDHDGVRDSLDGCPDVAGPESNKGCPVADRDGDGVADAADVCPDQPAGAMPDPARAGCPADSDKDGVLDVDDKCRTVPAGEQPDARRPGCPADRTDADGDGVIDALDQCPQVPAGKYADPARPGCPADRDGDGVIDEKDACIDVPAGKVADAKRAGCPADADGDSIPDEVDACPAKAGSPDPDAKKNGCPGLVKIENGQIVILDQVYFATGKDVILPRSFPVLQAVLHAVKSLPAGRSVRVEGHTDDRGDAKKNVELSQRRADAVKRWLVDKGIPATRLIAEGKGPERPIDTNKTDKGRARNRRVEFHIAEVGSK